ncbi:MAG: sigma 54-interacting transcriptional regulator [Archangium sp.]
MSQTADDTLTAAGRENPAGTVLTRVVVLHGPEEGRTLVLEPGHTLVVGRKPEGDGALKLDDAELSKQHFKITLEPERAQLEDLGSRNGTFVQGRRVQSVPLNGGEIIRAGTAVLCFERQLLPHGSQFPPETETLPGPSLKLARVRGEIALVAKEKLPVLVLGETGVGKELVAESIHRASALSGPFLPVNCGAITTALAESEFFGHEPGAFTGAVKKTPGLFQAAHRGTLFLDEVAELPLEVQAKLLRALSRGEVRPVGGTTTEQVDVRVIAATHRDLAAEVAAGRFREDLLARLAWWTIRVPPLRERAHDTLALARRFLGAQTLSADAAEALALHPWPQNVRELQAVLHVARVRAQGGTVQREHLPAALVDRLIDRTFTENRPAPPPPMALPLEVLVPRGRTPSREELVLVMERLEGSIAATAEFFGKDRKQVYRWLERFGIATDA